MTAFLLWRNTVHNSEVNQLKSMLSSSSPFVPFPSSSASVTMSSTLAVPVLYWLVAQSFAITKLADWEHLFTSICLITAHLHSNGAHNPICFSSSPVITYNQSAKLEVVYPFTIFAWLMIHYIHSSSFIVRIIFHWPYSWRPEHSKCFSDTGLSSVSKNVQLNYHKKRLWEYCSSPLTTLCSSAALGHHFCLKTSPNHVYNSSTGMHQLCLCSIFGLSTNHPFSL